MGVVSSSPLLEVLANSSTAQKLPLTGTVLEQHHEAIAWLLDRLDKSTAGVRGVIASTTRLTQLLLEEAEASPQLRPTVVAVIAQAYAQYFKKKSGQVGVFVGFDARFLSHEFGNIFTRVLVGNGIRVYRDHRGEPTPTPVTSFMACYFHLSGGIQITASHNPPNHNGVKSSTWYGGVDTDDISDAIAAEVREVVSGSGEIVLGSLSDALVSECNAKHLYAQHYLSKLFSAESLTTLKKAGASRAGFLFDGLHGVGGMAMRQYLDLLLGKGAWESYIHLLNDTPDSTIGGIEKPDPSLPDTLVKSGAISRLLKHPDILLSVTADMDADRIGTAVVIPANAVARAKQLGLFVTEFEGGIHAVRFTPNQVFTLIAYDRLLQAKAQQKDATYHVFTTIASTSLVQQLADTHGLHVHYTAVGFKNLGKLAWQIDQKKQGDVILSLLEESGGAQIGPFSPWNEAGDTIHRDKDTCALALALFVLAARLHAQQQTILDFYNTMVAQFGCLIYFERLDAYLPTLAKAEDPTCLEEANQVKGQVLDRLLALTDDAHHATLLNLLGYDNSQMTRLPDEVLENISLLGKKDGTWQTIHPSAVRYKAKNDEVVSFYRAGVTPFDGLRVTVSSSDGKLRHWCLIRASGTEPILRVYMEVVEPLDKPRPERLGEVFSPLLHHIGLGDYSLDEGSPDYVTHFQSSVKAKY